MSAYRSHVAPLSDARARPASRWRRILAALCGIGGRMERRAHRHRLLAEMPEVSWKHRDGLSTSIGQAFRTVKEMAAEGSLAAIESMRKIERG